MKRAAMWWTVVGVLAVAAGVYAAEEATWGHVKAMLGMVSSEEAAPAAKRGGQTKVDICHWDAEMEVYKLIRVAAPAVSAHLEHGDGMPGEGSLDGNCEPVTSSEITVELPGGATMDFIWVEPGSFEMGGPAGSGFGNREPFHTVTITQGYYLAKYEITREQWEAVEGPGPWAPGAPLRPAAGITWSDVQQYVQALNDAPGDAEFRLPTEAEWEYACRAGTATKYSFGDADADLGDDAWYGGNSGGATHDVGTKLPNPWGFHDVHGNVWEWVQDYWSLYSAGHQIDPLGPTSGSHRVARGGSYLEGPLNQWSASRGKFELNYASAAIGARLVVMLP